MTKHYFSADYRHTISLLLAEVQTNIVLIFDTATEAVARRCKIFRKTHRKTPVSDSLSQ